LQLISKEEIAKLLPPLGLRAKLEAWIAQQRPTNNSNSPVKNNQHAPNSEELEQMKAELAAARKAQEELQKNKDAELKKLQLDRENEMKKQKEIEQQKDAELRQAQSKEQKLALENELSNAKVAFYDSIANSYENLKFEVTQVERVAATAVHANYETVKQQVRGNKQVTEDDLKDRWVFHSTLDEKNIPLICASSLRPSGCEKCKHGEKCSDPGCLFVFRCSFGLFFLFIRSFAFHLKVGLAITRKECM
jgi:hypothetical protein